MPSVSNFVTWLAPEQCFLLGSLTLVLLLERVRAQTPYRTVPRTHGLFNLALGIGAFGLNLLLVSGIYAWVYAHPAGQVLAPLPPAASWPLSVMVLDLTVFVWHKYVMHGLDLGYRFLHRVHHTERYLEATSAYRFHPLEVLFSQGPQLLVVWLLGLTAGQVGLFYLLFSLQNLLVHANIRVSPRWEKLLSPLLITPHVHRLHHQRGASKAANFGTIFSFWDRLLGSYRRDSRYALVQFGE